MYLLTLINRCKNTSSMLLQCGCQGSAMLLSDTAQLKELWVCAQGKAGTAGGGRFMI